MLFLYDPRTNVMTETDYDYLFELTGYSKGTLMSYKSRGKKLKNINSYLVDEKVTLAQRREWYCKESYPDEIWLPMEDPNSNYKISNYGRFIRIYKNGEKLIMPYLKKSKGTLLIKLNNKEFLVSTLVAAHFLGKPKKGYIAIHKNSIKTDNFVGNLQYVTKQEHGKRTGFKSRSQAVIQFDRETNEIIGEYRSAREAGRRCFLSYQAVMDNCNGKSKTSGGYVFKWEDEFNENVG